MLIHKMLYTSAASIREAAGHFAHSLNYKFKMEIKMKFTPQETAKLVEIRSRFYLATRQYLQTPASFDALLAALWQLHSATDEYNILLARYFHRILEIAPSNSGFLVMSIAGSIVAKELLGLNKAANAIMYDQHTREAYKAIFAGSPVTGLSTPINYSSKINTGGQPIHHEGRMFHGTQKSEKTIKYVVTFSDDTTLTWVPSDDMKALHRIRQQFDEKVAMLARAPKLRLA